jgi:uncharacterized repeat protein (TIGR01451 family)
MVRIRQLLTTLALGLGLTLAVGLLVHTGWAAPGNPVLHPPRNSHNAPLTTTVSITYDEPIDPATVNNRTFAVHGMQSGLVTGTHSVRGGTIIVTPTRPFHQGELVYAVATKSTLSITGTAPLAATQWQFRAGQVVSRVVEGFSDVSAGLTGVDRSSTAWGDYDNDGDLDILLTGCAAFDGTSCLSHIAKVYRNDGGGSFSDISAGLTGVMQGSGVWGDYDSDGDLDILLAGHNGTNPIAKVYRNNGSTFTDISAGLTGAYMSSGAWGDYDNDGDLDILLTGHDGVWGYRSYVYRNDGGGSFNLSTGLRGVDHSSVAWGDYDNDGDLDILLAGESFMGFVTELYRNDGGGTFTLISVDMVKPGRNASVAWGDYDNDGDLDILIAGSTSGGTSQTAKIYRNDGGDTFTDISAGLIGVGWGFATWGDYDNDGDLDVLLAGDDGPSYIAKVYRNDGGGSFSDTSAELTGVYHSSGAWGDYDNDGDLDVLLTGNDGSNPIAKVYRNDSSAYALRVTKYADPDPVQPGAPLTYTIRVTNPFDLELQATITDTLPEHITLGRTSAGTLVLPGEVITWTPVSIAPLGSWTQTVVVTVEVGYAGPLTNVVKVETDEGAISVFTLTLAPGLAVSKQAHTEHVVSGEQLTYTICVTNTGNFDLQATITDTLPEHVTTSQPLVWASQFIPAPDGVWTQTVVVTVEEGYAGPLINVVRAETEEGANAAYTHTATVEESIAGLYATNDSPTLLGNATTLTATVTAGSNVSYDWAFGDGTSGTGSAVEHVYPNGGCYIAVVTASNGVSVLTATTTVAIPVVYMPLILKRWPPIPYTPVLNRIDNADQDNYYTVTWREADLATTYVLEEATNTSFSDAQEVYQGAGLSWTVPSPGKMPGTYYYRVKARNTWGETAWSNVQFAVVVWAELIVNGGFESGPPASPWVQYSNFGLELIDDLAVHTGSWSVYMGGLEDAVDQIHQRVKVPATAPSPRLYYWRLIRTSDYIDAVYDEMRCVIWDTDGNVLAFCGQYSNVDQSQNWIQVTYDMSAFRGQTVDIGFKAFNDELYPTQFFIDDVSLVVTASRTTQTNRVEYVPADSSWGRTELLEAKKQRQRGRLPSLIEPMSK